MGKVLAAMQNRKCLIFISREEMSRVSQARNLGKYFLLIDNMLVVLGFFVVFPLISIRFVDQMGWAAVMVGIALGLRQFIQQGLGIFGGVIADRFGAKPMIVTGMLMRAAGFATMGIAHEPWLLWFSCLLSGLGGTLFDPPRSALVVKLIRPQQRGRFFSLLMMQDSAGAVIGALLGSWLLQYDFRLVCATGQFYLCYVRRSMRGCYQHGNSPPYARPFAKA